MDALFSLEEIQMDAFLNEVRGSLLRLSSLMKNTSIVERMMDAYITKMMHTRKYYVIQTRLESSMTREERRRFASSIMDEIIEMALEEDEKTDLFRHDDDCECKCEMCDPALD